MQKAYDKTLLPAYGKEIDPKEVIIEGGNLQ